MQTSLTLEHLASYLPYGLQMANGKYNGEITQIFLGTKEFKITCSNWHENIAEGKYKPLLLPLDKLLNIDWIGVFQAGMDNLKCPIPENCIGEYHLELTEDSAELLINSCDSISFDFVEKQFSTQMRFNQLSAFNELFKLHADLNELIASNLAIDKSTYKP